MSAPNRFVAAMTQLLHHVFEDFAQNGGLIHYAGMPVLPQTVAAANGVLPAYVWQTVLMLQSARLPYPPLTFVAAAEGQSLTGYALSELTDARSAAILLPTLHALVIADIAKAERTGDKRHDLQTLLRQFRKFCSHLQQPPSIHLPFMVDDDPYAVLSLYDSYHHLQLARPATVTPL
jgi:hypothetical protein